MIRLIVHGAAGHMGQVIAQLAAQDDDCVVVAGIDAFLPAQKGAFPIYATAEECVEEADCLIDFSTAKAADDLIAYCVARGLPCVLCTTGLTPEQEQKLKDASATIPVLRSANMSIGINLLLHVLKQVTPLLSKAGYDIEVVEKHHHRKIDAPSGTALALADAMNEAADGRYHYVFDRRNIHEKRSADEIGFAVVRGGTIVGEHEVLFAGEDEVISFKHEAFSRAVFGKGALAAAKFLAAQKPGFYTMQDLM